MFYLSVVTSLVLGVIMMFAGAMYGIWSSGMPVFIKLMLAGGIIIASGLLTSVVALDAYFDSRDSRP